MDIITNWVPRNMVALYELPAKQRAWFDYVEDDEYSPRFVQYKGEWYDIHDTQRTEPDNGRRFPVGWGVKVHPGSPLCLFDSVESDTYFSGLLFRFVDDDKVIVARYMS